MGLDNGIILRLHSKSITVPLWLQRLEDKFTTHEDYTEYDICYWRKCYGLREDILDVIPTIGQKDGMYILTVHDIPDICKVIRRRYFTVDGIKSWNTSEMYDWGYSFQRFREGLEYIINLYKLRAFMKMFPASTEVYFYDSY